jgi:hypothetical protein
VMALLILNFVLLLCRLRPYLPHALFSRM